MVDPAVLAGGIWEALLSQPLWACFICIPALVGLRVLDRQMERTLEELRSLQHAWLRQQSLEVSGKSAPGKTTGGRSGLMDDESSMATLFAEEADRFHGCGV